jgi:hypothetical protein
MKEKERWEWGVAVIRREYEGLSPLGRERADRLAAAIKACKEKIHLMVEEPGAADVCASCGGECCRKGKNHFSAIDLVIFLYEGRELFDPTFERDICPYMGDGGCLMAPGYRPYNCITFICEKVEGLLGEEEKRVFYAMGDELRALCRELEGLFHVSLRFSLLSVFERRQPDNSYQ